MGLQPLDRHIDLTVPEPVTKTAAERLAEIKAQTRQKIRDRRSKRNVVGYGKSRTELA